MRPWEEAQSPLGLAGGKHHFSDDSGGEGLLRSSPPPLTRAGAARGSRRRSLKPSPGSEGVLMGKTVGPSNGEGACPASLPCGWDGRP